MTHTQQKRFWYEFNYAIRLCVLSNWGFSRYGAWLKYSRTMQRLIQVGNIGNESEDY